MARQTLPLQQTTRSTSRDEQTPADSDDCNPADEETEIRCRSCGHVFPQPWCNGDDHSGYSISPDNNENEEAD